MKKKRGNDSEWKNENKQRHRQKKQERQKEAFSIAAAPLLTTFLCLYRLSHSPPLGVDDAKLILRFSFSAHLQQSTPACFVNSRMNPTLIHYVCMFVCVYVCVFPWVPLHSSHTLLLSFVVSYKACNILCGFLCLWVWKEICECSISNSSAVYCTLHVPVLAIPWPNYVIICIRDLQWKCLNRIISQGWTLDFK